MKQKSKNSEQEVETVNFERDSRLFKKIKDYNKRYNNLSDIRETSRQTLEKLVIFLVGVLVTVISISVVIGLQFADNNFKQTTVWQILVDVFVSGIPIGLISVLFSFFDKLSYAKHQVSAALYENEGYLLYDEKTQIEIKNRIEQNLHLTDIHDSESLYSVVQSEISDIVQDTYINEYNTTIDCDIEDGMFVKKFHEYIVYKNPNLKKKEVKKIYTEEMLSTRVFKHVQNNCDENFMSGKHCANCGSSCLRDVELWIDGKKKNVKVKRFVEKNNNTLLPQYSTVYRFSMAEKYIDVGENPVTVEIKFNTRVPIEDNIYVHKVKRATRNYTLDFRFNSNKMDIIPVSFGFMDENNIGNRVFIAHSDMGKQIRFRNWVLPGDGVIIVINKKNNADKLVLIGHTKDASNMEDIENINECRAEVAAEEVK